MIDESNVLYPLDQFCARAARPVPTVSFVKEEDISEPYRSLLVHKRDMTSTLERFHGANCHLTVLDEHEDGETYSRQVVLLLDGSNKPVEFGAIAIYLERFPDELKKIILEGQRPLGAILNSHNIQYISNPQVFMQVQCDGVICQALHLTGSPVLFGRRNRLSNQDLQPLADIIEILPPY